MADSIQDVENKKTPPSYSHNLYWLLLVLLPLGWWTVSGGRIDGFRRALISLAGLAILIAGLLIGYFSRRHRTSEEKPVKLFPSNFFWGLFSLLSVSWWIIAGSADKTRSILLAAVGLGSFMIGALVGFIFTSFGDELATFGKIRDWVIAGITGATLVELAEQGGIFKNILQKFTRTGEQGEFGLVISMAVVYFSVGFFFMFLQRELLLNLPLAKSRAERGKLDGTVQAGLAIQRLLQKLSPSLLTGQDDIDAILDQKEAADTRKLLEDDDVKLFLNQAEQAVKEGRALEYDAVSKVAYIYYYKVYSAEEDKKQSLGQVAIHWVQRALVLNPMHIDLLMKYADLEMILNEYVSAAAILERSLARDDVPAYVRQWLGYALLQLPDRLQDSIRYSEEFLRLFPDASASMFNIAIAYAKLYCRELKSVGKPSLPVSPNRRQALQWLEEALMKDPDYREHVQQNYSSKGGSFECMDSDPDYRRIVGLDQDKHQPDAAPPQI
jgi:tetratricopeptide (TPR) repeat protein